ncbi:MAG: 16S rRNA (guanine(966)-N(2))-methyltransferase RsmD [Candidatus Eutrophobiaceae bacterium]
MKNSYGCVRIIGGQWRHRKLSVRLSPELRPTPNRLRETLFNWLAPRIEGAECLDLFAGTGALGFEVVSRGAAHAVLVEKEASIFAQLQAQKNAFSAQSIDLIHANAFSWIKKKKASPFEIVFLDPPFGRGLIERSCQALLDSNLADSNTCIYAESEPGLTFPAHWQTIKCTTTGHVQGALLRLAAS